MHKTPAFVLKSRNIGESNKLFYFLTKNLGAVKARAEGVRELKSKLRYHLQDLNWVRVSLVKGREYWKVTGGGKAKSLYTLPKKQREVMARIFSLVSNLSWPEDPHADYYPFVESLAEKLCSTGVDEKELSSIELLTVLRLMRHGGYLESAGEMDSFLNLPSLEKNLLESFAPHAKTALKMANRALSRGNG